MTTPIQATSFSTTPATSRRPASVCISQAAQRRDVELGTIGMVAGGSLMVVNAGDAMAARCSYGHRSEPIPVQAS